MRRNPKRLGLMLGLMLAASTAAVLCGSASPVVARGGFGHGGGGGGGGGGFAAGRAPVANGAGHTAPVGHAVGHPVNYPVTHPVTHPVAGRPGKPGGGEAGRDPGRHPGGGVAIGVGVGIGTGVVIGTGAGGAGDTGGNIIPPVVAAPAAAGGGKVPGSGVPPLGERRFVPDEIIVAFLPAATPQTIDVIARRYNLTQLESQSLPLLGATCYRWRVSGRRSVADTIGAIEDERIVAAAQPNYVFTLQDDAPRDATEDAPKDTPGDTPANASSDTPANPSSDAPANASRDTPAKASSSDAPQAAPQDAPQAPPVKKADDAQYVLGKLQVEQAHEVATGKDIPVAVIDSGIDARHPDLGGAIVKSFDAVGGEDKPHQHGTAIAGAIAAHGKLSGIAQGPRLLAARAFDDTPGESRGTSFAIWKSLQWSADNGVRVINMSFAGPPDPAMHRMLTAAFEKGIVLVAAAGNAGPNSAPLYPAADPDVIAVTATDSGDGLFSMANHGKYIAVAAPGVEILALAPDGSYQVTTGTSVAAAHVSGIAAMLLQLKPSLKPAEVRELIMSTAQPLGTAAQQPEFGAGLVNAYRAVTRLNEESGKKTENQKPAEDAPPKP